MPVAGKTGTVSEPTGGTRDIWTIGYTPELAVAVWMGFDEPDEAHALPSSAGGSGYPARLCASFLSASADSLSGSDFPRPKEVRSALLDTLALQNEHVALLSTARTPKSYTTSELFHEYDMPETFSANWLVPQPVQDFRLLSGDGEMPVLAFTVAEATAEYLLLRESGGETSQLAVLSGEPGREVRFADDTHALSQPASYTLLPRNARLFESGILLTGPQTPPVRYSPGGLLNKMMGVGAEEPARTPTEVEYSDENQSLFG